MTSDAAIKRDRLMRLVAVGHISSLNRNARRILADVLASESGARTKEIASGILKRLSSHPMYRLSRREKEWLRGEIRFCYACGKKALIADTSLTGRCATCPMTRIELECHRKYQEYATTAQWEIDKDINAAHANIKKHASAARTAKWSKR